MTDTPGTETVICRHCGARVPPGVFCGNCGEHLEGNAAARTVVVVCGRTE